MADNKAKALKEADYTIKLILGSDPEHGPKVIDISQPVKDALDYEDVVCSDGSTGIAYKIIGVREQLLGDGIGFGRTEALRTPNARVSLYQNVLAIIQASIVNAKQYEAVKSLIDSAFSKDKADEQNGAEYALLEASK